MFRRYSFHAVTFLAFACLAASPAHSAVKGRAFGCYADMPSQGVAPATWCDSGWLDADTGGDLYTYETQINFGNALTVNSTYNQSQGDGCRGHSDSQMASGWIMKGSPGEVRWTSISSHDDDECCRPEDDDDYASIIVGLMFGGVAITPSGAVNETFTIPGVATLVVNESHHDSDPDCDDDNSEHRAIHVTFANGDSVILASAKFDSDDDCCPTNARRSTWGNVKSMYR